MSSNSTVSFVNMPHQPALQQLIQDRLAKLRQIDQSVVTYQVTIEARHQHHAMGRVFSIDILRAGLDGRKIQVAHVAQMDLLTAVSTALDEVMRESTRSHDQPGHAGEYVDGHITHLSLSDGTGTMQATGGETIGFHQDDVADNAFADLRVGDRAWWFSSGSEGIGRLRCMNRNRQRRTPEIIDTRTDPPKPISAMPSGEGPV